MKYRLLYHFLFLFCVVTVSAQSMYESRVSGSSRPVWQQTKPNGTYYLENRRALTGTGCCVNRIVQQVGVANDVTGLECLLDDELNNYVSFPKLVGLSVAYQPIISVRDTENYYEAGTEAGFCIVAKDGESLLSLDLLNAMGIALYKDGQLMETLKVETGDDIGLLGLSLINISGKESSAYLNVTSTKNFDEIALVNLTTADIGVGANLKIKYAFVGKQKEVLLTTKGITDYVTYTLGRKAVKIEAKGFNPYILGIPTDIWGAGDILLNDDLTDQITITPLLNLFYKGGAYIKTAADNGGWGDSDDDPDGNINIFEAGSEVGFKYYDKSVLNVGIGDYTSIVLFDINGKQTEEIMVSAGVLALGAVKSGNGIVSVVATKPFSGAELRRYTAVDIEVAAWGIYYGFVREPVDVQKEKCKMNLNANSSVCGNSTTLTSDIKVDWRISSQPDDATASLTQATGKTTIIQNMNVDGEYVVEATCKNGCNCKDYIKITTGIFGQNSNCGQLIVNDGVNNYVLSDQIHDTSGSLITLNDIKNKEAILSPYVDDYAEYIGGLSLANDLRIIGVKTNDGSSIYNGTEEIRAGFVVELQSTGLDLDLLEFFQIRLYNNGVNVLQQPVDNSNVLSVGLAGSEKVQKLRLSVNVPANTKFDEITLWRSGVLNLNISKLRIYYPFYELPTDDCSSPWGCGSTIVSSEMSSTWNMSGSKFAGVVSAITVINDMCYFVDNDMNTAMTIGSAAEVSGKVFAINMGRVVSKNHQLGIVIDSKTYLAGVGLANWITVETYRNGVATGDKHSDWKVLGVDAIGYGDKSVLLMRSTMDFDEVRITIALPAGVLETRRFYGMFVRGDVDGDGIPDCEDENSCGDMDNVIPNAPTTHICEGDDLSIYIDLQNAGSIETVDLNFERIDTNSSVNVTSLNGAATRDNSDGKYKYTNNSTTGMAGVYKVTLSSDGSDINGFSIDVYIHPNQTTWNGSASSNWNNWDNWTRGVPFCCTDVVIPSGASCYPVLSYSLSNPSCCNNIHFEPGAQVVNSPELAYRKAWVEAEFNPNRYYLFSAPLKEMVTGDMFVPAAMNGVHTADKFTELDKTTSPENRFNPSVFQRVWQSAVDGKVLASSWNLSQNDLTDTQLNVLEGEWSRNFNAVAHPYKAGNAVSVWVDNGALLENTLFRFRFPKEHTLYHYYSDIDQTELGEEAVSRNADNIGRFIYETELKETPFTAYSGSKKWNWLEEPGPGTGLITQCLDVVVEKDEDATYSNTFLVGNPFLSYVNIEKFLEENADKISEVRLYNGNTTEAVVAAADGSFITNATSPATTGMIAPMEGFYVRAQGRTSVSDGKETLRLRFTPLMLEQKNEDQATMDGQETSSELMRLNVYSADYRSSMVIAPAEKGAKSELLLDGEVTPALALFAADQDQACDVLSTDADVVPLGFMTAHAETVTLSATGNTEGWLIRDRISGKKKSVAEEIKIEVDGTSVGRYELVRNQDQIDSDHTAAVIVSSRNGRIHILSPDSEIRKVIVYDLNGQNLCNRQVSGNEVELTTLGGIRIVEVFLESGKSFRTKILD